ncbi:MAG: PqqD family protein [Oliverpabstia sp.]
MKIVKEFILRDIAGEWVLVPINVTAQEFNGLVTLSSTGKFIWENIEKVGSLDAMIDLVLENYEIDKETATKDVIEFVAQLVGNGFVECTKEDKTW